MTALAKCKDCAAITLDTDDDARKHREWHRDYDQKFRNTRSAAIEARNALSGLRAEVKDLRDAWDEAPDPIVPDEITVTDMPDDDALGLHDPDEHEEQEAEQTSQYAGDDTETAYVQSQADTVDESAPRDPLRDFFTGPTIR